MTSPPCEENVVWFIKSSPVFVGSTYLNMFRDVDLEMCISDVDRKFSNLFRSLIP